MGRPRKNPLTAEESAAILAAHQAGAAEAQDLGAKVDLMPKPIQVMRFQMGLPCDLLGSKISFSNTRNTSLEATPLGIVMRSKESRRKMLITWANVKAAEFAWDME